jgi:hypothetical protein
MHTRPGPAPGVPTAISEFGPSVLRSSPVSGLSACLLPNRVQRVVGPNEQPTS